MTCKNCGKLILEAGVSYGINPNAVCTCTTSVPQNTPQSEPKKTGWDYVEQQHNNPTQLDNTIDSEVQEILEQFITKVASNLGKYSGGETAQALTNLIAQEANKAVVAARHEFFKHQFDINEAWEKFHGNKTYEEFAEDYLSRLTPEEN